jgi:hypothetical protein
MDGGELGEHHHFLAGHGEQRIQPVGGFGRDLPREQRAYEAGIERREQSV